jgi:diguanylate cyclase (GGDEF)-like protein
MVPADAEIEHTAMASPANDPGAGSGQAESSAPLAQGESRLVFLIERDATLAQDLAAQIRHFGYVVQTFGNLALLKQSANSQPSAVIVDIVFPAGSPAGVEAIQEIRHVCQIQAPVLFISGRGDLTARLEAVRAGADAYFTKPISVSELIDTLDALTARTMPEPYRILVVEEDTASARQHALILEKAGMMTRVVNNPRLVMDPLIEFGPDLIVMDAHMPECAGVELAAVIRQQKDYVSIPIVYLSTDASLERQLAALRQSGDDFLTEPIQSNYLVSSVTSRAQRSRVLRSLMLRDGLTGLFNHTATADQLGIEIARARRQHWSLSFAMIDIDHFKMVNDTYGHGTGDRVLKSLAQLFQQRLRKTDIVGRYGGEEFAIILPGTEAHNARRVMDEIRTDFAEVRQQSSEGAVFCVTFSGGVASFPDYVSASSLAEAADKALYQAKREGRNRVVVANKTD